MTATNSLILLVDDDELQLDLIGAQLAGFILYQVVTASSGEQALAHFETHGPNIAAVVCDLSMPGMDGLVLLRHLAQRGYQGAVLLLSGVHDDILHSAAGLVDAHGLKLLGVLTKPCATSQLQALLANLQPLPVQRSSDAVADLSPQRLVQALRDGEFIPWFQPKVDVRSGLAVGVEALARWPQADASMISPVRFIPAIEAAQLSDELFFAMARQVAEAMAHWRTLKLHLKAAINLSMDTALNLAMPEQLGQIVHAAGLSPADFVIEVTESQLMVERTLAMESLTRLSLMGFTLSIDDFGTGYSSLVQLIDLPFKELKIDGSFVQRSSHELKAQSVLRVAILLGHSLGMDVIAEGVETAAQLDVIRGNGCHLVQGFFLARPMPFGLCTEWLQQQAPSPGLADLAPVSGGVYI